MGRSEHPGHPSSRLLSLQSASMGAEQQFDASRLAAIELLAFDVDGTLTDATTWWGGDGVGWLQRYSVRDGEALLRLVKAGSRNKTESARRRMTHLKCALDWMGVSDKVAALAEIRARYGGVPAERVLHIGDGPDDAPVFAVAGVGVAVADAHAIALEQADLVLDAGGGQRTIEELEARMRAAGHPRLGGAQS